MKCSLFNHVKDNTPKPWEGSWRDLVGLLEMDHPPAKGTPGGDPKRSMPAICGASFRKGATRCNEDVVAVAFAGLDFDNQLPKGKSADMKEVVSALRDRGIQSYFYSTWSSTPVCQRFRVILPLADAIPGRLWPQAVEWILDQLGLNRWRECMDIASMRKPAGLWFLPGAPDATTIKRERIVGNLLRVPEQELQGVHVPPIKERTQPIPAKPAHVMKDVPPPVATKECEPRGKEGPVSAPRIPDRTGVLARAAKYLANLPPAISGQGGHPATFAAALKIQDGYDLTVDEAFALLLDRFNPRCEPPWTEAELLHKVRDAAPLCQNRGHLLREPRRVPSGSPDPPELPPMPEDPEEDLPDEAATEGRPKVQGFQWGPKGLYTEEPGGKTTEGKPKPPEYSWIAPPFTLPGLVRDEASHGWRLLIAWKDLDKVPHEEALPFELMCGEGAELARTLGQGGLVLSPEPGPRKAVLRYLCSALRKVKKRVRLVETLGWHEGGAFVLPDGQTIGRTEEPVRYAGDLPGQRTRATFGTLEGWKDGVAQYAVGNPRLAFAIASAFAGPCLELVRPDGGGGFNLQGFSSKGKSTCLEAAASVWSCPAPLPTWRSTANGLEGLAAPRNDGFLVLDELSQVDSKEAGSSAYLLANGSAKARANREGGNRPMRQWRLVFLSSGEQGLEDKLGEDGKRVRGGQEVRVPDIPCPASGMFEDAHGMASMGAFAEHLKAQARKHYGHAARAFLEHLCEQWGKREALQAQLREMEAAWLASAVPPNADPQVRRVAGRFALVAVAGELAQRMGILSWPNGEAERAALVCFKAWLDRRGFSGASETYRGIAAVLAFMEKHGQARFDEWGITEPRTLNRAGTRKRAEGIDGWDYFFTTEGWKEACQGFTSSDVARACVKAGILEPPGEDRKCSRCVTIPGYGRSRYYAIRALAVARFLDEKAT